jgi:hypothetical protein
MSLRASDGKEPRAGRNRWWALAAVTALSVAAGLLVNWAAAVAVFVAAVAILCPDR